MKRPGISSGRPMQLIRARRLLSADCLARVFARACAMDVYSRGVTFSRHLWIEQEDFMAEPVKKYIVDIIGATRGDRNATLGISPRGSIALYKAAKAFAYIYEREYVTPDDVKIAAVAVLAHRIILSPQGKSEFGTGENYIRSIIENAPVPAM